MLTRVRRWDRARALGVGDFANVTPSGAVRPLGGELAGAGVALADSVPPGIVSCMSGSRVPVRQIVLILALSAVATGVAWAQGQTNQPPPPSQAVHPAGVIGVVVDSINRRPLEHARVRIEGTALAAQSDSNGRFRFDSIPPGTRRFVVRHPLADSLGLEIVSRPIELQQGIVTLLALALPSAATLRQLLCSVRDTASGFAMIRGRVMAADTDSGLAGARVTFLYQQIRVSADSGVRRSERLRQATTERDGSYTICGVPEDVTGTLVAELGSASTPEFPVTRGTNEMVFRNLALGIPAPVALGSPEAAAVTDTSDASSISSARGVVNRSGQAILRGRVIAEDGSGVAAAQVAVAGTSRLATTQADGSFRLESLPSGTSEVLARKIGFSPASAIVDLTVREPRQVTLMLRAPAPMLEPVRVVASMEQRLQRVGFTDRRRMGMGRFMDAAEIERHAPIEVTDIIRRLPGFRIVDSELGRSVVSARATYGQAGCLNLFVDHGRWDIQNPGDIDRAFKVHEIAAVEAYAGDFVPQEFIVPGRSCATIVVWTKH